MFTLAQETMVHIFPLAHGGSLGEGPVRSATVLKKTVTSVWNGVCEIRFRASMKTFLAKAVLTHMEGISTVPPQIAQIVSEKNWLSRIKYRLPGLKLHDNEPVLLLFILSTGNVFGTTQGKSKECFHPKELLVWKQTKVMWHMEVHTGSIVVKCKLFSFTVKWHSV